MYQLAILPQADNIVPFPQKSNEWYTPSRYIEAARSVMGSIDLDPASCELANRTVKATRFYSAKENGLAQEWKAQTVWLNPPYGSIDLSRKMGLSAFIEKLITQYSVQNIQQAILLATSRASSSWFSCLWNFPICFVDHDIQFDCLIRNKNRYNGKANHSYGSIFVYLGPHEQRFIDIFSQFGTVARRVSPAPVARPITLSLWEGV